MDSSSSRRSSRGRESKDHLQLRWGSTRRYRCQHPEPQPESTTKAAAAAAGKREREREREREGTPAASADDKQQQEQQQEAPPPTEPHWNLRSPTEPHWNLRSKAAAAAKIKPSSSSSAGAGAAAAGKKEKKEKKEKKKKPAVFWFSLSKEEIEADFLAMTGSKPPPRRYANRRPRTLQNEIDCMSPGFFLPATVDANTYKVPKSYSQY